MPQWPHFKTLGSMALALALVAAGAAAATHGGPSYVPSWTQFSPYVPSSTSPSQEMVNIKVLGIRATVEAKPHVDPILQPIVDEIRRSKFNSFYVVAEETRSVATGTSTEIPLAENYSLRVEVEKATGDDVRMNLIWLRLEKDAKGKVQPRTLQRMQMTIRKGKYFLTGGWTLKDGVLSAAIAAQ
jgi:hypothetical protein